MTTVEPGQSWADCDKRAAGRVLRVDRIEGEHAICTVTADRPPDEGAPPGWTNVGATRRIALRRFKPGSTGYRLVPSP